MKIIANNQILFFKNNDVIRLESDQDRTTFHFQDGSSEVVDSELNTINDQIKDSDFIRVHKDHVVNTNFISKIPENNSNQIELTNGAHIPVTASTKTQIIKLLEKYL